MTESAKAPDALFDADLSLPLGREDWIDRFDWVVVDGRVVHAPASWTWSCPECGETGVMPDGPDLLASPHGSQHAQGVFGKVVPLDLDFVRHSAG